MGSITTPKEQVGSYELVLQARSAQGTRVFITDWANRESLVHVNDSFPGKPFLKASQVKIEGYGKPTGPSSYEYAKVTVTYQTYQAVDDAPLEQWEFGGEVLECGEGRIWWDLANAGAQANVPAGAIYVSQNQGVFYPSIIRSLIFITPVIPVAEIVNCTGKINWAPFMGFAPECVLFAGASADAQFDYERGMYIYRLVLKFHIRMMSWNVVWRAPFQNVDIDGNLLYNSDGSPQYATTGDWDRPYPFLYNLADFNPLVGLPPNPPPMGPPPGPQ